MFVLSIKYSEIGKPSVMEWGSTFGFGFGKLAVVAQPAIVLAPSSRGDPASCKGDTSLGVDGPVSYSPPQMNLRLLFEGF